MNDVLLAHHPIVATAGFFVPALIVAGVFIAVVVADRRRPDDEPTEPAPAHELPADDARTT